MPQFDGTGPQGYGPRTGGGFGRCLPNATSAPLYGVGRGGQPFGGGRGFTYGGRGRCRMMPRNAFAPVRQRDDAQEREWLQQEAQSLQAQLDRIQTRLSDLTRPTEAKE